MPHPSKTVSTILRTYNRKARTIRAIRSVLDQTVGAPSIIVVDDASTDGTVEAVQREFGDRVTLVSHHENRGPGAAANTGLDAVKTEFAAFLDSDDLWDPAFLENVLNAFKTAPGVSAVYCDVCRTQENYFVDRPAASSPPPSVEQSLTSPIASMSTLAIRTRSARAAGGFDPTLPAGEDFDFLTRLWLYSPNSFVHLQKDLVTYSIGDDNITGNHDVILEYLSTILDRYLYQPYFQALIPERSKILSRRALRIAGRKQVAAWLRAEPTRPISLIILGEDHSDQIERALASAASQRLPPVDVVVAFNDTLGSPDFLTREWPFALHPMRYQGPIDHAQLCQRALAACHGSLVTFLHAGDTLHPTALDDHRRAFSSSLEPPAFSYGGTAKSSTPAKLPLITLEACRTAILENTPGTISAMAVSRKRLIQCTDLFAQSNGSFWLALVCRLTIGNRPAVRIRRAVTDGYPTPATDNTSYVDTLRFFSKIGTRSGFASLADEMSDIEDFRDVRA